MATADGTQDTPIVSAEVKAKLWNEPFAFDFFQAVRLLENSFAGRSEVGRFFPPEREIVRFQQSPSLSFPPADILALKARDGLPPLMTIAFMGLLGTQGVMPRPYTEFVLASRDTILRDFLDLFHHRLISLFYLAWRKYRTLERASSQPDPLPQALYHLIGLGTNCLRDRQAVPDPHLLFYAGLLAQQPRSAAALESIIHDYFQVPVRVEQFVGAWYTLDADALCSLDEAESEVRQLGTGSVVGHEVWEPQARVRLVLGPLSRKRYSDFLPTGNDYRALRAMARFFSDEVDFEAQLVLKAEETPGCLLGETGESGPRLGWLSWVTTCRIGRNPADTIVPL